MFSSLGKECKTRRSGSGWVAAPHPHFATSLPQQLRNMLGQGFGTGSCSTQETSDPRQANARKRAGGKLEQPQQLSKQFFTAPMVVGGGGEGGLAQGVQPRCYDAA